MTRGQQLFAIISSTTMTPYPVFTGCQATLYADLIGAFNSSGSARRRSVTDFRTHRFIPTPRPIRLAAFSRSSRTCSGLPFRRGVSRATGPLCASRSEPRSHTSYNSMISRITFNSAPCRQPGDGQQLCDGPEHDQRRLEQIALVRSYGVSYGVELIGRPIAILINRRSNADT